jgi:Core-2/I-Branching enzyme
LDGATTLKPRPLAGFACLILAHDNPAQLLLLLRWLVREGATCHLHIDPRGQEVRSAVEQADLPRVAILPVTQTHRIEWGGFAMVKATLALMRAALAQPGIQQLCLLSGTHLPLAPAASLAARLNDGRNHLDLRFACMEPPDHESLRRFWFRGVPGREESHPLIRWLNQQSWRLGQRNLARCLRGLTPLVGSQWWHLTAAAAHDMLAFLDAHPWYEAFFRHAHIPDESFFHTLLGATPHVAALGPPMSYQQMHGCGPVILGPADLPQALASGAAFARKFDLHKQPEAVRLVLDAAEAEETVSLAG